MTTLAIPNYKDYVARRVNTKNLCDSIRKESKDYVDRGFKKLVDSNKLKLKKTRKYMHLNGRQAELQRTKIIIYEPNNNSTNNKKY